MRATASHFARFLIKHYLIIAYAAKYLKMCVIQFPLFWILDDDGVRANIIQAYCLVTPVQPNTASAHAICIITFSHYRYYLKAASPLQCFHKGWFWRQCEQRAASLCSYMPISVSTVFLLALSILFRILYLPAFITFDIHSRAWLKIEVDIYLIIILLVNYIWVHNTSRKDYGFSLEPKMRNNNAIFSMMIFIIYSSRAKPKQ